MGDSSRVSIIIDLLVASTHVLYQKEDGIEIAWSVLALILVVTLLESQSGSSTQPY